MIDGVAPALAWLDDDWSRCLAVVAHPDDIEYGMSMAVPRWTSEGRWVGFFWLRREKPASTP